MKRRQPMECIIEGCKGGRPYAFGLCLGHYTRRRRYGDPLKGERPLYVRGERVKWLQDRVSYEDDNCLIWPFGRAANGYGQLGFEGRASFAHRAMCCLSHGPPPTPKHHAAHSCGRGKLGCVNPKHISWKTAVENEADKIAHGTIVRGNRHAASKLSEADVLAIRASVGVWQKDLAQQFGVNQVTISKILARKVWAWL